MGRVVTTYCVDALHIREKEREGKERKQDEGSWLDKVVHMMKPCSLDTLT